VSLDLDLKSDAELIVAVREGDTASYGVLYERHLHAAKRAATCLVRTPAEREDLVADAFTRVLRVLRDGGGPKEEFRAYLLVTMRNAAISSARGATVTPHADVPESYFTRPDGGSDPVVDKWDAMTAAAAFASLPERWRTVLWHTEVEDESPAEIAPLLGMRPNGVAALAYRAREGLRQAYLRAHLADVEGRDCQATVAKLAGWVRHNVPVPLGRKITKHLAVCADCRARADTLARVNEELRASVAPLLLGAAFAAAYAPAAATSAATAGVAVKTLIAKVAVVAAIAATAVTTVASSPEVADSSPGTDTPILVTPIETTDSIDGPPHRSGTGSPGLPGGSAPATTTTTVPATATDAAEESEESTDTSVTVTTTDTTDADSKAEAKAEKKAAKEEAKASKKAEKEAAKESKKAEKGK
jgi:RNA polymerase sigma factor (sigma-70 family)